MKPSTKPANPRFGSGPCAKRPGWDAKNFDTTILGRSHRSVLGKKTIQEMLDRTRSLLNIPKDYHIAMTPASDTGAVEMALWNMLGPDKGVDIFVWEHFSREWLKDIEGELKLKDCRAIEAPYGEIADLSQMQPDRDAVFVWNGTTSGVCVPDGKSIPKGDKGLRICDATSAVFAYDMPWEALDIVTWSWQKVMGGEGQHGMIVISPKAMQRLQDYKPSWPVPKVLKPLPGMFEASPVNTPSMLCVLDAIDALKWMEQIGGLSAVQKRVQDNAKVLEEWVARTPWIAYLATDPSIRSKTSICFRVVAPEFVRLLTDSQIKLIDRMADIMELENVAFDIKSYKSAPLGFRIWGGATVESADLKLLTQWLDWAYAEVMSL